MDRLSVMMEFEVLDFLLDRMPLPVGARDLQFHLFKQIERHRNAGHAEHGPDQ